MKQVQDVMVMDVLELIELAKEIFSDIEPGGGRVRTFDVSQSHLLGLVVMIATRSGYTAHSDIHGGYVSIRVEKKS